MAKFRKRPTTVEAICISQPMVVKTATGVTRGKPGDWLIVSGSSEEYFVTERAFQQNYEPADDYAQGYLEEVNKRTKFGF